MKRFFENLSYKMQVWMQGRYGYDELSRTMMITALVCIFLSAVPYLRFLYSISIVLMIFSYIRSFSKNISARSNELNAYYKLKSRITNKISLRKEIWKNRKTHRYFKCKNCKAVLRVPKGKGKIEITCRVCKNKMRKKT